MDALLREPSVQKAAKTFGRALVKRSLVQTLDEVRAGAAMGAEIPGREDIRAHGVERSAPDFYGIDEVLNATVWRSRSTWSVRGIPPLDALQSTPPPSRLESARWGPRDEFY